MYLRSMIYVSLQMCVAENMCSDFTANYWKVARVCPVSVYNLPSFEDRSVIKSVTGIFQSDLKESTF